MNPRKFRVQIFDKSGSIVFEDFQQELLHFDLWEDWMETVVSQGGRIVIANNVEAYNPTIDGII